jgi:hypothetical protein
MNTTIINYAHTVARLAGVDAAHLTGLDLLELSVLHFGILSDDAPAPFRSTADHLETAALEMYALASFHAPAERAYCELVLARRAVRARRAA